MMTWLWEICKSTGEHVVRKSLVTDWMDMTTKLQFTYLIMVLQVK